MLRTTVSDSPGPSPKIPRVPWRVLWIVLGCVVVFLGGMGAAFGIHAWMGMGQETPRLRMPGEGQTAGGLMPLSVGPMRGREEGPGPTRGFGPPRQLDEMLAVHLGAEWNLSSPADQRSLREQGRIAPCWSIADDSASGLLFAAGYDGLLRLYDRETLELRGTRRLQRPASRLVIDSRRRLLCAASVAKGRSIPNILGEREYYLNNTQAAPHEDLDAYELDPLVAASESETISPRSTLALGAYIVNLIFDTNEDRLYYLAESPTDLHIGKVETATWKRERSHSLNPGNTTGMVLAPDEPILYCMCNGRLLSLNVREWRTTQTLSVNTVVYSLAAGKNGLLYIAERRPGMNVLVVDWRQKRVTTRLQADHEGRTCLAFHAASNRLYVGTSAILSGRVLALDTTSATQPPVVAESQSDRRRLLRGAWFVSDDGKRLINGGGTVFRTETP